MNRLATRIRTFTLKLPPLGLMAGIGLLLTADTLISQTAAEEWTRRNALKDELNDKISPIQQGTTTIPLNTTGFGTISVKSYTGGCVDVNSGGQIELVYNPAVDADNFIFRFPLKAETVIDVPPASHLLPCHLNDGWLYWMWKGFERHDTGKDSYGFDENCGTDNQQKYYMRNLATGNWRLPLVWVSAKLHTIRLLDGSDEIAYAINPKDEGHLVSMDNGTEVMAYRDVNPSSPYYMWNYFRRVKQKLIFDYTESPVNLEYVPHPDVYWADINAGGNASGTKNRLESIEFVHQYRSPSPDNCPNSPALTDPSYNVNNAIATFKISYLDGGGNPQTAEVVWTSTDAGKNATPEEANEWLWSQRSLVPSEFKYKQFMHFDVDEDGYMYLQLTDDPEWNISVQGLQLYTVRVHTDVSPEEYCEMTFPIDGTFCVDDMTGDLVYYQDPNSCPCTIGTCEALPVRCIDYCTPLSRDRTVDNVIAASAGTLSSEWTYDPSAVGKWYGDPGYNSDNYPNTFFGWMDNRFQRGQDGMWRLQRTFAYRSDIKNGVDGQEVYDNAGVFVDDQGSTNEAFTMFNWQDESANNPVAWLNATTITQYAPSGEAVEEKDIIDIYSAAKLAHDQTVAGLVAANARYDAVAFECFEEHDDVADDSPFKQEIVDEFAHSGKRSYALDPNGSDSDPLVSFVVSPQTIAPQPATNEKKGVLVKLWIRHEYDDDPPAGEAPFNITIGSSTYANLSSDGGGTYQPGKIHKVAQTGEWTLYEVIKDDFISTDDGETFAVVLSTNLPSSSPVWVDDIRVQPLDAQMGCYVYDPNTLRLVAQFDDQHFGAYYQYNGEGKLVRTLRETERGLLTVAESQYHSFNEMRSPFTPGGSVAMPQIPISSAIAPGAAGSASSSSGADFDLLNLHIGPDGTNADILQNGDVSLPDFKAAEGVTTNLPRFDDDVLDRLAPDIPIAEKAKLLDELRKLDEERGELAAEAKAELSVDAKAQLSRKREEIECRRGQILYDRLGLTEEEVDSLYKKDRDEVEKTNTEKSEPDTESSSQ